jgi:prepilin-type N-terminal cleavage/methylation domain-containing protein
MRRPRSDDAGFTLIELVVAVVIMGIIFVPLADFFIQYLDTTNQTQQRLSDSHDLQLVAAYFSQDVANTGLRNQAAGQTAFATQQSVWTSSISATFCGAKVAGTPILKLAWDDESVGAGAGSDTVDSVLYAVNGSLLVRDYCNGSTLGPAVTLVHNLSGTPSVTCSTTCSVAPPPVTVQLTLRVQDGGTDTSGTSVTLTGQRRQSSS